MKTPLPVVCVSKSRYASSACSRRKRCVSRRPSSTFRSATKRAHSAWPTLEKVHEAWIVSCRRIMSWLMSNVVVLPSPTKATRPHVVALRTAATRASGFPVQSIAVSTPSPCVSSRSAATGSVSFAFTTVSAPKSRASASRSGATSIAITRAPIARPSRVALARRRVGLAHAGAARGDDAAGLVAGHDGTTAAPQAQRRGRVADRAIGMEIAPAHPRGLHGDDDLAGAGCRVGELTQLELPATEEHYATHTASFAATLSPIRNRQGSGGNAMQTMKLGEVTVSRVIEIDRSSFPTASMLPDSQADVIAGHHRWLKPHFFDERTGDLASRIQTYVVRTPRHTVLIATGVGNDKPRPRAPAWNMRTGSYLDDLAAVGVTPEQVDFVVW